MPLYEYECEECGHRFERIRKFSDPPLSTCPECAGPVRKLLSAPAIQFKGTGWYVTDYARKSGDPRAAEGGKDAKSADGTDTKPSSDGKSSSTDGKSSGDGKSSSASASGSDAASKPKGGTGSSSASSSAAG
jgi:putative FmdB family regulatory protein